MKIELGRYLQKKLFDVINDKFVEIHEKEVTEEGELTIRWRIDSNGFFNIYLDNQNILSCMIQMVDVEEEKEND